MNPTKFMLQCVYTPADKVSSHVTDSTNSYTLNHWSWYKSSLFGKTR